MRTSKPHTEIWSGLDASVTACSDVRELCNTYVGSMQVIPTGLDGTPIFTVEVSNNGTDWGEYSECAKDIPVDDMLILITRNVQYRYYRVCIDANDNTTGTLDVVWFLKGY